MHGDLSLQCLSTGIGSLPHTDPESAVKLIVHNFKEIPHWPQLPRLAGTEGLVTQYLSPLMSFGLAVQERPDKSPHINTEREDWPDRLADFYSAYLEVSEGMETSYERFAFPEAYAAGFYAFTRCLDTHGPASTARWLKGQISGPITVGLQLTDQNGRSAYYDEQLRDLVVKNLSMQAAWQVKALARFNLPVIIFIDEPALYAYGLSTHITLKKEDLLRDINTVVEAIHGAGARAGVHSCARTDWSILLESKADIVSFDAYGYFDSLGSYSTEVSNFLLRGGVLAWGIVPITEEVMELKAANLVDLFRRQVAVLAARGINSDLLKKQVLITPSCGIANLGIPVAEKVYHLTAEVSSCLMS